ncbi:hypothetical protein J2795_004126 [Chryseobacterium bernardetii]|uniref:Uncharacterized protein n=2 Tax=Chryseobacterium TaxID=59732 RepID=A0A543EGW9_9FLAO|nr:MULTISPECIES: hypothetical protein [Chryseobacterium]MDR6372938.1 hypothetical protein [Chryseobacterium vietnamense]MDR6443376.1 hypothetical protein [Chryseobacterium bernardetii]TQM20821.1 hypothetical protein FB551_0498 [Chryseobacterium aquifrigidense]
MDITETLQAAVYSNNYWKHSDFSSVMEALIPHYNIDIEMDTEKITILRLENKIIAYICLHYPLIFIESQHALQVKNILHTFHDIEYIIVDTLSNPYLSVNPDIYNVYFDLMENLNAFSAEDFYFYNVN